MCSVLGIKSQNADKRLLKMGATDKVLSKSL